MCFAAGLAPPTCAQLWPDGIRSDQQGVGRMMSLWNVVAIGENRVRNPDRSSEWHLRRPSILAQRSLEIF